MPQSELRIKEIVLREDGAVGLVAVGRRYPDTVLFQDMLGELDRMGIDYDDLEVKKNVPVSFIATCETSTRVNNKGEPFLDVISLRLPEPGAAAAASSGTSREEDLSSTVVVETLRRLLKATEQIVDLLKHIRDLEESNNQRLGRMLAIWENQEGGQGE